MFPNIKIPCGHATPCIDSRRRFLGGALLLALAGCGKKEEAKASAVDLTRLKLSGQFNLRDPDGHIRTLHDYRGDVVLLIFGYTQCPDVCPTSLARAAQIRQSLGEQGKRLRVLFVTVDPERDTPDLLKAYTAAFDPTFVGLYGDAPQTADAAKAFGAFFRKVPAGNSYTMDHSSLAYVIDAEGKLRFALQYEESVEDSVKEIRPLL